MASARARIGLLGNPSDGYGGRVIAATVADFSATVRLEPSDRWVGQWTGGECDLGPGPVTSAEARSVDGLAALLAAAIVAAGQARPDLVAQPARLEVATTIPRQVGLSGSSAIIVAALRALARRAGAAWKPADLALAAWRGETQVLGWTAGPQDRVIQAHDGVLDMDFSRGFEPADWVPLDAARLPPVLLAWDRRTGQSSNIAHSDVRARYDRGDREVIDAMARFADLARLGCVAIEADTAAEVWPDLIDEAFEMRQRFWPIAPFDAAVAAAARRHRAAAALAGSGGALVIAARPDGDLDAAAAAIDKLGAGVLRPTIQTPGTSPTGDRIG